MKIIDKTELKREKQKKKKKKKKNDDRLNESFKTDRTVCRTLLYTVARYLETFDLTLSLFKVTTILLKGLAMPQCNLRSFPEE